MIREVPAKAIATKVTLTSPTVGFSAAPVDGAQQLIEKYILTHTLATARTVSDCTESLGKTLCKMAVMKIKVKKVSIKNTFQGGI